MAYERFWEEIPQRLVASDGTKDGTLKIDDLRGLYVKQIVNLISNAQPVKSFQIKRIDVYNSTIWLGPQNTNINTYSDLSIYLQADGAAIWAARQEKNTVPKDDQYRGSYETEPIVARRVIGVDSQGKHYSKDNPLPVQISSDVHIDNVDLEVRITAKDNDPEPGRIHDSVRIGDGVNEVGVTNDGKLKVETNQRDYQVIYSEHSGIANGVSQALVNYTATKEERVRKIEVSGDNIAEYILYLNSAPLVRKFTHFGNLNTCFEFDDGLILQDTDTIELMVIHYRQSLGSFNSSLFINK